MTKAKTKPAAGRRPLLDVASAADYLATTDRHVRRLVQDRRIPYTKLGPRKLRFDAVKLDAWLEGQSFAPEPDPSNPKTAKRNRTG